MNEYLSPKRRGIIGLNRCFRKILSEAPLEGAQVAFVGSPSVCLPFAEMMAYAVRDLDLHAYFVPNAVKEQARSLTYVEGYGFQLGQKMFPEKFDVLVIQGGCAMPGTSVKPEDISNLIEEMPKDKGLIIGVGFMGVFDKEHWTEKVRFDYIIDCTVDPVKVEKFLR